MVQRLRYSCRAQCRSWNSKKSFSIAITKCEGKANRSNWDCWVSPHSSSQRFMRPPPPEQRAGGRFCFNPASGIHVHLILCGQGRGTATCTLSFSWEHAQHLFPLSPLLSSPRRVAGGWFVISGTKVSSLFEFPPSCSGLGTHSFSTFRANPSALGNEWVKTFSICSSDDWTV